MIKLLYGNEPYLIDDTIRKARVEVSNMGFATFEEFSNEVEEFASQYPFCDPKQILVVQIQSLKNDEVILKFVKSFNSTMNDIYFVAGEVDKRTKLFKYFEKNNMLLECLKINETLFKKFVLQTIKSESGNITEDAFNLFKVRCGYWDIDDVNLYTVKTYIFQLLFANDDKNILPETIQSIVPETLDHKTFELTNCLLQKDGTKLFALATALIDEKENPIGMLSLLLRCFRLAYKATLYNDIGEKQLGTMLGAPFYQFKSAMGYSPVVLEKSLDLLQDGVNQIKAGAADSSIIFYITLGKLLTLLDT